VGTYTAASAAPILAAAISGTLVVWWLGTSTYSLHAPDLVMSDLRQYGLMLVTAVLVSVIGILVMRAAPLVERVFGHKIVPVWFRPVIDRAMVLDLSREMLPSHIALLIVLRLGACLISLASGFRGGLLFASLFIGSLIRKLFAAILNLYAPAPVFHVDPNVSVLTAMACLGVAIVGGPLTMSLLVLEMTRSLEITVGVLASRLVTNMMVRQFFEHSFST